MAIDKLTKLFRAIMALAIVVAVMAMYAVTTEAFFRKTDAILWMRVALDLTLMLLPLFITYLLMCCFLQMDGRKARVWIAMLFAPFVLYDVAQQYSYNMSDASKTVLEHTALAIVVLTLSLFFVQSLHWALKR